jgi:LuxR family maltose regulon positive regulatory protein
MIKTKLSVPPLRQGLVPRLQLIARLNEVQQRPLALISAPGGFGKTTLVVNWLNQQPGRELSVEPSGVAWLSLEKSDNDPARFWRYVLAALQTAVPDLPEQLTAVLEAQLPLAVEGLLTDLLNALTAVSGPLFLVLDDYHLLQDPAIQQGMTFLLDHLPPPLHLILITRQDPPLSLARWRGQDLLVEIRQSELAFSETEAAQFLNDIMGLSLTDEAVAVLAARTEGWIAGLQMAALSMRDRDDVDSFLDAFTGSHRYVADYLMDEVWQHQSPQIQFFLLQTAVLDELYAPLCARLLTAANAEERAGQTLPSTADCQAILEKLERTNLFIIPLDDTRQQYRYHHLFAGMLRQRLAQAGPERAARLHDRAGSWYEENERFPEAIEHYLQGELQQKAALLIEKIAETVLMRSEIDTLLNWLAALNHEAKRERPLLFVYQAGASLLAGKPFELIERELQEALTHSEGATAAEVHVLQGLIAAFRGDATAGEKLSEAALDLLPEDARFLRSLVAQNMALIQLVEGDVNQAMPSLRGAAELCASAGNVMSQVICLAHAGELAIVAGQLLAAQAYYEEAVALAVDGRQRPLPIMGIAKMGLGELYREWNRLQRAAALSQEGLALIQGWGQVGQMDGYIWSAQIRQAQGDEAGAVEAMRRAAELALRFDASQIDDVMVGLYRARLDIQQGRVETARHWLVETGVPDAALAETPYHIWELGRLTLIYLAIARQKSASALELVADLLPHALAKGRLGIAIDLLVLQGLAAFHHNQPHEALAALQQALALAAPEGYIRTFIDKGDPIRQLLLLAGQQANLQPDLHAYVDKLLATFAPPLPAFAAHHKQQRDLVEPLSEREIEVLQRIVAGYSNREIAAQLTIAHSTVKTHINNIYSKLGVQTRSEAIERAQNPGFWA